VKDNKKNLGSVDALACNCHRSLVLRLENNIHHLELLATVDALRGDTAILGVRVAVEQGKGAC